MSSGYQLRIYEVVGEPLSGVAFVQDYTELHFDGKIVRALADPVVSAGGETLTIPEKGSRDLLCGFIGQLVSELLVSDQSIVLKFGEARSITIPLRDEGQRGPEAAHYMPYDEGPMEVW